jgi:hypothetical protein
MTTSSNKNVTTDASMDDDDDHQQHKQQHHHHHDGGLLLVLVTNIMVLTTTTTTSSSSLSFFSSIEEDLSTARVFAVAAAALVALTELENNHRDQQRSTTFTKKKNKRREGKRIARPRTRRSVVDIYRCLGPGYFRRAYRMSYETFWKLHAILEPQILASNASSTMRPKSSCPPPPIANGKILTSVRLACALRYFAGASPYDLMTSFGISHVSVLESVWIVVQAINCCDDFLLEYPESHEKQQRIAAEFKDASGVDFDNCAGAIDGILIWIHKPSESDAATSGCGRKKFLCARKHKFGLNCQAVSDCRGRILDISITYGGSAADCIAFEASDLYTRLERGLLAPGLVLFGDNAYLNTFFMATPFPRVSSGCRDDYNFYHSQVSILPPTTTRATTGLAFSSLVALLTRTTTCSFESE